MPEKRAPDLNECQLTELEWQRYFRDDKKVSHALVVSADLRISL
jgi:hypothetical protein